MKITLPIVLLLAAAFLAAPPACAADLTPHTAQYKVKISLLSGQLNTELRVTDDGYVATHVVKPTGIARLRGGNMNVRSEFKTAADGVRPVAFREIDTIRNDPETNIRFDWTTNRASGTVGDDAVDLQLEGLSHDNVSIQYELMHDLLNSGPSDTYVLFDVDKMRVANVRNVGKKTIKTKAGSFEAVGIQHQKVGSSRVTTLWCARELGYLPIVIEQHRKGKLNFKATLTRYTPI
ncbi:MAG: DUF3108 domain-containing protein [Gammaproteobacteria bacterium]|nr:DUF3108 domain-containing protein [Gammaproteobacteria bacterium]